MDGLDAAAVGGGPAGVGEDFPQPKIDANSGTNETTQIHFRLIIRAIFTAREDGRSQIQFTVRKRIMLRKTQKTQLLGRIGNPIRENAR